MTWSLKVSNGDLTLSNAGLGTVTAEQKLVQDLRCFILEKMGTDDMHPTWGSLIDGGTLPNGQESSGIIGQTEADFVRLELENEIRRIVGAFQQQQLERARNDQVIYSKATLTKGEVLFDLTDITLEQVEDQMNITLSLQTGSGDQLTLDTSLFNPAII